MLVNSNPATIMTEPGVADRTYIEPLTVEVLERVIARERPDGLLPTLGGQTGLNLAVQLHDAGILERYDVRLLGTPLESIRKAEDREEFRQPAARHRRAGDRQSHRRTPGGARTFRKTAGLPLIVRPAYTLGGTGGGSSATTRTSMSRSGAASTRAPSARCCWSAPWRAGKRSSTR